MNRDRRRQIPGASALLCNEAEVQVIFYFRQVLREEQGHLFCAASAEMRD
jgi:hypothetical protein